jgi:hypothetical protein
VNAYRARRALRSIIATLALSVSLAAYASDRKNSDVGKPLSDAVVAYGPPVYSFDSGDGTRTFVWSVSSDLVLPGQPSSSVGVTASGNTAQLYGTANFNPPINLSQQCNYALDAKRTRIDIEGAAAWVITGFSPSRADCE